MTAYRASARRGRRVTAALTAGGDRVPCDVVVLTCDLPVAYRLLGRVPRRPARLVAAPSAVVVHLGVSGDGRRAEGGPAHHHLLFGRAWRTTFDDLIRDGRPMRDPSLLLPRPTATDPALAPDGRQLLSVLAPAPNLARGPLDWDRIGPGYAEELIRLTGDRTGLDLRVEDVLHLITPADWRRQGLLAGTPFSLAHTFGQTGPFRPANLPRMADNAVLAGCGTVPGVGVPTALLSGRLAADRVTGVPDARTPRAPHALARP